MPLPTAKEMREISHKSEQDMCALRLEAIRTWVEDKARAGGFDVTVPQIIMTKDMQEALEQAGYYVRFMKDGWVCVSWGDRIEPKKSWWKWMFRA